MEFYVDIADLDKIKEIADYYPISGFTTNPKILAKAERPVQEMMEQYMKFASEQNIKVFFQVTGSTAEEMFREAKALHDYFGEHFVVKIPAIREGYKAVRLCKEAGITVLVTVVHSVLQAVVAARAGADYVAPYINHIDNLGADGVRCVEEILTAFHHGGYSCKVLGASFRNADQIKRLAVVGCQAVTILPEMFDTLISHPSTDNFMHLFHDVWVEKYGTLQIDDLLDDNKG